MTATRPAAGEHPADKVLDPPLWARSLGGELREQVVGATVEVGSLPVLDGTVQRMLHLLDDPDSSSSAAVGGDRAKRGLRRATLAAGELRLLRSDVELAHDPPGVRGDRPRRHPAAVPGVRDLPLPAARAG